MHGVIGKPPFLAPDSNSILIMCSDTSFTCLQAALMAALQVGNDENMGCQGALVFPGAKQALNDGQKKVTMYDWLHACTRVQC